MNQTTITQEEAGVSSELRRTANELLSQTRVLLEATRTAVIELAPRLTEAVAASGPDGPNSTPSDDTIFGSGTVERVERAVAILHKISTICKNNADTGEKAIRLERQVRGDPTDIVTIQRAGGAPESMDQILNAIDQDSQALRRHLARQRGIVIDEESDEDPSATESE